MCEQAKSLSRETYQVSITLMVARRDSYRDFHKEGYHGDCDCNGQEMVGCEWCMLAIYPR